MDRYLFYWQYALRNLWRNRRWSFFAVLSVAAGVATVVALRSMGLAITDSLTQNIQASNKGDITLSRTSGPGGFNFGVGTAANYFSNLQLQLVREWIEENDAVATEYSTTNLQLRNDDSDQQGSTFMTAILIEPTTYPPTTTLRTLDPPNQPLENLLTGGRQIIVSETLAEAQRLDLGSQVQLTGATMPFEVVGIVSDDAEANLRDPFAAFFGFSYLPITQAEAIGLNPNPNNISILLPPGTSFEQIEDAGHQLNDILALGIGYTRVLTVPSLIEQNEQIADLLERFVVVLGLGAMLIGGVGIINTMLVMVRRRTTEIATLKTFGLKGKQIAALFMAEAILIGLIGSVVGSLIGAALSRVTNAYGEQFIQQSLPWRIYPEALVFGVVLGVVVTAVFGFMPVLTAVRVRPGVILRPNESKIPPLGVVQSLGATLFVVLALGLIAGHIIGPFPSGVNTFAGLPLPQNITAGLLLVAVTLAILATLTGVLWVLIWLISQTPNTRWIELNLSIRNLGTNKLRTATTLLAISTGIFALSAISFYGAGVREILQLSVGETFGGNILIISPTSFFGNNFVRSEQTQQNLNTVFDQLGDQVTYRTRFQSFDGRYMVVGDRSLRDVEANVDRGALFRELNRASQIGDFQQAREITRELDSLVTPVVIVSVQTDNPDLQINVVDAGRELTLEDTGKMVAVVLMEDRTEEWGLELGSDIVLEVQGEEYTFEVVGLVRDDADFEPDTLGTITVPFGTLPEVEPNFQINTIQVPPDNVESVQRVISAAIPFVFTVDVRLIDGVVNLLIEQFSALPILIGGLSLAAAAVIMANTVALATFERRRQIGILKAVGLKRRNVIWIMILENVIISILGALIGIGASIIIISLLTAVGLGNVVILPADSRPVVVGLVIASVLIGLLATLLSVRSVVKEKVLNVLRYE